MTDRDDDPERLADVIERLMAACGGWGGRILDLWPGEPPAEPPPSIDA